MTLKPIFDYLKKLKKNNNRDWFNANKDEFGAAQEIFDEFVFDLIQKIQKFDPSIGDLLPKNCIFRIYRDTRFAKDKTPYKTNFGAAICKGGRKSTNACYYIHLEPGASMLGGGLYMPPADRLLAARKNVVKNGTQLLKILKDKTFKSYFGNLIEDDKLSRPPKGFDADDPFIELVKNKHYVVVHNLKDSELVSPTALRNVASGFEKMKSLKKFLDA